MNELKYKSSSENNCKGKNKAVVKEVNFGYGRLQKCIKSVYNWAN